jgi:hypothetical protein
MASGRLPVALLCALGLAISAAAPALGHGGEAAPASEEAEVHELAMQPARVLAQQALAELRVRADRHEAGVRLDAALESRDHRGIDTEKLRQATETLDMGNTTAAIPLLDEALSRPLGSDRGKALHEAGREFKPATGPQEIVAIVLGAFLLVLGTAGLWRTRHQASLRPPDASPTGGAPSG